MSKTPTADLFDYESYLLKNYKYLGISEDELVVLVLIIDLLKDGNKLLTAELLALRMTKKKEEIDKILLSLMEKGYLVYESTKKGLRTSIEPLRKKLIKRYTLELNRSEEELEERNELINSLRDFISEKLNRKLLPVEYEVMNIWLNSCFSEEDIKNAVEDCLKVGKSSFYYFNIKLVEYRRNNDFVKEGNSAVNLASDPSFEETVEIVKTKWVDSND